MKSIKSKLILSIGIIVLIFSAIVLHRTYNLVRSNIKNMSEQQLSLALDFDLAIRSYVAEKVRPMTLDLVPEGEFLPETMSTSFVARNIFEKVQRRFSDYIIKFSAENPRNPLNKAGPAELKMIRYFNQNPNEQNWTGEININGKQFYAKFSAMRMEKTCLRCHGDPADAPAKLIEIYGAEAAFYLPLGKVVGLDTIAIPYDKITQQLKSETITNVGVMGIGILLLFISLVMIVKFVVTNRLSKISAHFQRSGKDEKDLQVRPIKMQGYDEISALSNSYNKLASKLNDSYARLTHEIEKRQLAEKKTSQSEAQMKLILNSIPDNILQVDKNLKIIWANKTAMELNPEAMNHHCHQQFLDTDEPCTECPVVKSFQTGKIESSVVHHTHVRGTDGESWWDLSGIPIINESGEITGAIEFSRNITANKLVENSIRNAQKMESIGTLVAGVAHDFNNILGIILGNAELAMDEIPEWNVVHENLEEVKRACLRAKDVVRQLLSAARKADYDLRPVAVDAIVTGALKLIRSSIPSNIEIRSNMSSRSEMILADPTQINQIMINLCTNAAQAMEKDGGVLDIRVASISLDEARARSHNLSPGRFVQMTVADTGHGIDPDKLNRIFDPYFTTREIGKGSGLGLAVVRGIVANHGGAIYVDSEVGKGARFHVLFPITDTESIPEITLDKELSNGGERILFVDDEVSIVKAESLRLERQGYKVEATTSPVEALNLLRSKPDRFDLVITDLTMPQMPGDELIKEILKIRPGMPVIICTGFSEKMDVERARTIGAVGYLEKPHEQSELINMVRSVLH